MEFQNFTTFIPAPKTTSDTRIDTAVGRFPIDAAVGPHTPQEDLCGTFHQALVVKTENRGITDYRLPFDRSADVTTFLCMTATQGLYIRCD